MIYLQKHSRMNFCIQIRKYLIYKYYLFLHEFISFQRKSLGGKLVYKVYLYMPKNQRVGNSEPLKFTIMYSPFRVLSHGSKGELAKCGGSTTLGGFLENICTGMLKVDFRMLTISIPVYCKKKNTRSLYLTYD